MAFFLFELSNQRSAKFVSAPSRCSSPASVIAANESLFVVDDGLQERPEFSRVGQYEIFTFCQKSNKEVLISCAITALEEGDRAHQTLCEVDGQYLAVARDKERNRVQVISDRYGSRCLFWAMRGSLLVLSGVFGHIANFLQDHPAAKVDKAAVFEYLWFRRLFGVKTYREDIQTIPPASISIFSGQEQTAFESYWRPNSTQWNSSKEDCAQSLASAIRTGVALNLNSKRRAGLLLSGGLDARAALMVGRENFSCFTNAPQLNNEVRIAKALAEQGDANHQFIPRPIDYLDRIFEDACAISNGMTQYYECQFLGYMNELAIEIDEIQLGLFFDIFFCGHYMPKKRIKVLGRDSLCFVDLPLEGARPVDQFIHNVSYRQKQTKIVEVMQSRHFSGLYEEMKSGLEVQMQRGQDLGFEGARLWEYMHLVNVGRHYSSLMANSLRAGMDVHLPALTIECYDHAFNIPCSWKRNWAVYLKALGKLDTAAADFMSILNSNTNWPAKYGLGQQTVLTFLRGGIRKFIPMMRGSPAHLDRSWPWVSESLLNRGEVYERLILLMQEGKIWDLDILNRSKVEQLVEVTMSGQQDHSIFLNQLLTLEYGALNTSSIESI